MKLPPLNREEKIILQQATDNDIVSYLPNSAAHDLALDDEGKMQPFVVMTDYAEVNTAVESMKLSSMTIFPNSLWRINLSPDDVPY